MARPKNVKAAYSVGKRWSNRTKSKIGEGVRHGQLNKVPFCTRIAPLILEMFKFVAHENGESAAELVQQRMVSYLLSGTGRHAKIRYNLKRELGICNYCLRESVVGMSVCPEHRLKSQSQKSIYRKKHK